MGNINIAEILRDSPKGTKLYSPIFGDVYLDKIRPHLAIVVTIDKEQGDFKEEFLYDGRYGMNGECMIFPSKDQRDWSKFQRPFKEGDIVFYNDTIAIFKEWGDETLFRTYVTKYLCCDSLIDTNIPLLGKGVRKEIRFATEKEKQKLFDAIKSTGYKWNPETKTLEKLIEPKFKVGDKIRLKENHNYIYTITDIRKEENKYGCGVPFVLKFSEQDNWELVPNKFDTSTLKPFDKVLVRQCDTQYWKPAFWGRRIKSNTYPFITSYGAVSQAIPFKSNEWLVGTADACDDFYKTWK